MTAQYIRFSSQVLNAKQQGSSSWELTVRDATSGTTRTEKFDCLFICSGHHWNPNTPKLTGAETFKGYQFHSHSYKDYTPFVGKRVLVIGIGNSGVDVAVELSRHSKQVYLSTRSGAWILPRFTIFGMPSDHVGNTRLMNALPLAIRGKIVETVLRAHTGDLSNFGLEPAFGIYNAHPTINGELIGRIGVGAIQVKSDIARILPTSVEFDDGSVAEDIDVICYCTGYKVEFPYLDKSAGITVVDNKISLYKNIFPAAVSNIAFVGLIQPLGAVMPISEMQCRWATRVFSGKQALPDQATMVQDIADQQRGVAQRYKRSPRHTIQVDYIDYMDTLADQIGCRPTFLRVLLSHPTLILRYCFAPMSPTWFRLVGPHAWSGAVQAIGENATSAFLPYQTRKLPNSGQSLSVVQWVLALIVLLIALRFLGLF
ncbi:hypothetical protein CAOG_08524 [Capsaspora owczarzaki ATCC 30864]|uniref:Flavin-containing monooxygenase 5 n=1 Tax=Capsaspora owczarzaki (strain ATCC 30864) TaxID=595528 RepID=A0A0D2X157_CAPO3|nr:hypothetical protein CAOG_08524 [Capsaspora owczarzaki ATCC 30864]KJE90229.1 hypothetical protein CAOG_008524 [Capsaspora owczarzaki ATCC 30864]|eukprot:XP_011270105.1 hypothetical protein CAOG_08524 [Capsaspora owczarzaki ATCC 30864]